MKDYMDYGARASGRTLRMLIKAAAYARAGKTVYVVFASRRQADWALNTFTDFFRCKQVSRKDVSIGAGEVRFESATRRPNYARGTVLFDHFVYEDVNLSANLSDIERTWGEAHID